MACLFLATAATKETKECSLFTSTSGSVYVEATSIVAALREGLASKTGDKKL